MISFYPASGSGPKIFGRVLVILVGMLAVSCSPARTLATPIVTRLPAFTPIMEASSTPVAPLASPTPLPSPHFSPTSTENGGSEGGAPIEIIPTFAAASDILAVDKITSIPLGRASHISLGIDDDYIYWVGPPNDGYIFRVSKNGGDLEKIAASTYQDGRVTLLGLILSEKWLIFADTNTRGEPDTWKIRALNLEDRSERVVLDIKNDTYGLIFSFNMSAQGDRLLWTLGLPESSEDSISMLNLATGEKREILRTKEEGSTVWSLISLSKGQAVVERDPDAGGTDIYLLDLAGGTTQALSNDGQSNMPQFDFPWAVWKAGPRYEFARELAIYNVKDHQKRMLPIHGEANSDPNLNGVYVYWTGEPPNKPKNIPKDSLYIFDVTKNTIYTLYAFGDDQRFNAVAIHGRLICWLRVTHASFGDSISYLEWTTIR